MNLQRINLKIFLEEWQVSPEDIFKIFNRWISETSDEVLVDVADYSHVHAGPITLLVGHDANYCIDNTGGELGLLYARKQPLEGNLSARLRSIFARALNACRRLELEPDLTERIKFSGSEFLLVANDRLSTAATEDLDKILAADIDTLMQDLFKGAAFTATKNTATRPTLHIKTEAKFDLATLLENLAVN